jgi:hypothetical protein
MGLCECRPNVGAKQEIQCRCEEKSQQSAFEVLIDMIIGFFLKSN